MTLRPSAADFNRFFRGGTYGEYDIFTSASYRAFVSANDIDLAQAVNRYDGTRLIGSLAYGIRGERAWFGLIGVAHDARRRGLGGELVDAAIDAVRARGITRIELEIVQRNRAARKMVYTRGFVDEEELLVWSRRKRSGVETLAKAKRFRLEQLRTIVPMRAACWQREPASVSRSGALTLLQAGDAYAFVRVRNGHANIADAGARSIDSARALLRALDESISGEITLNNEPAGSPVSRACEEFGWRVVERQHRIVWTAHRE